VQTTFERFRALEPSGTDRQHPVRRDGPTPYPGRSYTESKPPLENIRNMKSIVLILSVAALAAVASAQTSAKPATATAKPVSTLGKSTTASSDLWWLKLPAGIPRVRGVIKTGFALHWEDIKIGTGPEAEPNKMYHVNYTGYLAATGQKFDSNFDRRPPVIGKDGKPVMGPDGKPELGEAQPFVFPQGFGRLIPGFDQGFTGMKIGGKRRIFIPWELAYGTRDIPAHGAEHPGIPPKSDLIFDVELVDVTDLPKPPERRFPPMVHPTPGAPPAHPVTPPPAAAPSTTAKPATPATAPATTAPATTPPAGSSQTPPK